MIGMYENHSSVSYILLGISLKDVNIKTSRIIRLKLYKTIANANTTV